MCPAVEVQALLQFARHAGAFFLVLLVRAKECLAPFLEVCVPL
jgi:hypothetical protein